MNSRTLPTLCIAGATAFLTGFGCQHIGPRTIVNDRVAYNKAILTSWEQQILLNLVRIRYHDLVSFVDVGSITQSHTLMGSISAALGAGFPFSDIGAGSLSSSVGGARSTTDTPSIVYTPQTSPEFTRNLNRALSPVDIFDLIESGYKPYLLLNMTLLSINDLEAATDRNFLKLTKAIDCAHWHGDLNFPGQQGTDGGRPRVFMTISDTDRKPCPQTENYLGPERPVAFIREALHLRAAQNKFEIVQGSRPSNEDEIVIRTRPVIAAMIWLSDYIDAPDAPGKEFEIEIARKLSGEDRPLEVHCCVKKPRGTFAAVEYRSHWFWIELTDNRSKDALIYLRILLALADTGPKPAPPVLTIPAR